MSDVDSQRKDSIAELRALVRIEEGARAIRLALASNFSSPLSTPDFERHLEGYEQGNSRALLRFGYQVRIAEREVMGDRRLVPLGEVDRILRSTKSDQEKVKAISTYLDSHDLVGLGEPTRFYVFGRIDDIREIFDEIVEGVIQGNQLSGEEAELHIELTHRLLAAGYIYRVAEELVYQEHVIERGQEGGRALSTDSEDKSLDTSGVWSYFHAKKNTESVLREKADLIARLVEKSWDSGLIFAAALRDQKPDISLEVAEAKCVWSETAALFVRVIYELASKALTEQELEVFIDAILVSLTNRLENKGIQSSDFNKLLDERLEEYRAYLKWFPEKDESYANTLFWEFGKKVATILNVGKNALFLTLLANLILKSLKDWQLIDLLRSPGGILDHVMGEGSSIEKHIPK